MNDKKLLKILCLHGYRQNAQTFRERTGALRKTLKNKAELVYVSSPNDVPDSEEGSDARGWWFSRASLSFDAEEPTETDEGFEKSLKVIENSFKTDGPYDGVLGFSQGAAMLAVLESLQLDWFKVRFLVFVSGFISRSACHTTSPSTTPSLHIIGHSDKVIHDELSHELATLYQGAVVKQHEGGHYVPATKTFYIDFLGNILDKIEKPNDAE